MKYLKNRRGSALIPVLILVTVVVVAGAALLFSVTSELSMNRAMEQRTVATYLAQAGIEHGLNILKNTPAGQNPVRPAGEFTLLNEANKVYKYEITGLTNSLIRSKGREIINGTTVSEVTLEASIDDEGTVTIR